MARMTDDKDRLGEKLRDKERGDEERYFAEQDRLRLEKLRAQSIAARGLCPRCGVPLAKRAHQGVEVEECSRCGGVWLDKGELPALLEREDEGWARRWLRGLVGGSGR
jgi:ribosomal protein L37AE/L43A